jgi:DNA-binding NarL/FixJ family response regulator
MGRNKGDQLAKMGRKSSTGDDAERRVNGIGGDGTRATSYVLPAGSPQMDGILGDVRTGEILLTIRANSRGELVLGPVVQRRSGEKQKPATSESDASALTPRELDVLELTWRELDVLELLARGWDNGRIAADLYISRATVKRHISSILKKLDVENRVQAAVRAVQEGILIGGS